ncbi:MAG: AraC family transcriptional regulator [Bacteroidaceae bacterium]|nr:AraC family transcriptional regulator [Bacteroidaceae bacterium]
MEIKKLTPRRGSDALRIDDSDNLVVMENIAAIPDGMVCSDNHGVIFICTEGRAQFEYDGAVIQFQKNDLFLYMAHSIASNFMASSNFNCKQIWFTRAELWNINLYSDTNFSDLAFLKQHPLVHLNDKDVSLLGDYFQLLCRRMRDNAPADIVRSLVSTLFLEMLVMIRRDVKEELAQDLTKDTSSGFHKRRLVDKFLLMVEQSDGRIRKVDVFANKLNISPKYLSTILKETMNRRPSEIIQLFTMKAIEHRLRFTDMTMKEISNDLNFPNASFFGKFFKEHSGMTPLDYRLLFYIGKHRKS